ncbi:MAG TPA: efflux RND transporter periplasmic adaptor subunit [Bacteroidales bacterium]|nr:efflux RND transporter periplasmic adaptor subunit [Bacteroidales bacterium]HRW96845.1 efflux RND transporter periplasmic adaptor subunit [Bacteroidales bacterium]
MNPFSHIKNNFTIIVLLLIAGCTGNAPENEDTKQTNDIIEITRDQFKHENMELGTAQFMTFENRLAVKGVIQASSDGQVQISPMISGQIRNIRVNIGDQVVKGETLCQIQSQEVVDLQQEFTKSASLLKVLKNNYEGAKILFENNIDSEKTFLAAESDFKSETARYNALKTKLIMLQLDPEIIENGNFSPIVNITSPIKGYITRQNSQNGQFVDSEVCLMEVIDQSRTYLQLYVFQNDVPYVQPGQTVRFFAPSRKEIIHTARITLISRTFDENTKAVLCSAEILDGALEHLFVGQNVEADIITGMQESAGVPEEAVFHSDQKSFVLVKTDEDNHKYYFKKEEIKTGKTFGQMIELIDFDLQKNILLQGGYNLTID